MFCHGTRPLKKQCCMDLGQKRLSTPGSDIDLSLHGATITLKELGDIDSELDDLLLPYTIDLLIFDTLNHVKLREHIERVGKIFYQKASN